MKAFLFAMLVLGLQGAQAGESCSVVQKVDGRLVDVPVPCAQIDVSIPCSTETRDARGWVTSETRPCRPGEQKTMQQVERQQEAAQRKVCGHDFKALRVGMSLERYEQCTDGATFVTETVTKGRVVETYRSTFHFLHVADGFIVGFTRRVN